MNIKTYNAKDMRSALRKVREEQGPDAVILSTRHLPEGVEVTVALDSQAPTAIEATATAFATTQTIAQPVQVEAAQPSPFAALLASAAGAAPGAAPAVSATSAPDPRVGDELRSMRHLLEWQLSQLAWNDLTRRAPAAAELLKELTTMGLAAPLAAELLGELPDGIGLDDAQRRVLAHLSRRLKVTGDDLLDNGGRVAFVGPTGVGKTTGIAKLAARWVMRHGPRDIALVSLDDQRFGAHEQLRVLGRLLGVECYALESAEALPALLGRLSGARLVLIDTAGISPRDTALEARATALNNVVAQIGAKVWLTLSAGAQSAVLDEAVQRFAVFQPAAVVLTKIDEAASLGGALSALAVAQLPVSYVAEGPRIPEDLAPARAHQLVARAVYLAQSNDATVGDELLARKFGKVAHAFR
ncbi:MAG TPA: flagellar biosynthesis protein FlhF [Steroidobacteraceae bacterium]|nr:flagellar biosynthesis protein FlhF [Steroidobacteraceae bacterium]